MFSLKFKWYGILLQETGIGKTVNSYRKHCYESVGNFARRLVAKWKQLVQLATEAVGDTQSVPAAPDDVLITADVEEKISSGNESKVDKQHLRTSSSKHKHLHASGNIASSKHHSSSTNKYNKIVKQDTEDVMFSNQCLETKYKNLSSASLTPHRTSHQCGDGSDSFRKHRSAPAEHNKLSKADLSLVTSDKSRHEKHSRLNKSTADDKNKGKYHSDSRGSAKASKSASHKTGSHIAPAEGVHANIDSVATDRMLYENGREVSVCQAETDASKSLRKSASKTRHTTVHKGSEKKSSDLCISERHSDCNASVPSRTETHRFVHVSKDEDQADVKTFTLADDANGDECNGMTFEQMLNYDHHNVVRKKKGGGVSGSKCSKVPKSASHSISHVPPVVTKKASKVKPDSGRMSKHKSCLLPSSHKSRTSESDEFEGQQPVIPHPDSQVGIEFFCGIVIYCMFPVLTFLSWYVGWFICRSVGYICSLKGQCISAISTAALVVAV